MNARRTIAAAALSAAAMFTPIATASATTYGNDVIYVVGSTSIGVNFTWPPAKIYDLVVQPGNLSNHMIGIYVGRNPIADNWCVSYRYYDNTIRGWGYERTAKVPSYAHFGPFSQGNSVQVSAKALAFGAGC